MKKRTAELILQDPEKFAHHDRVFLNNPVVHLPVHHPLFAARAV